MTSFKQIGANRHNTLKSTSPRMLEGKRRSRCNAVRHGLTAETVITGLEDLEDYETALFELVRIVANTNTGFRARPSVGPQISRSAIDYSWERYRNPRPGWK